MSVRSTLAARCRPKDVPRRSSAPSGPPGSAHRPSNGGVPRCQSRTFRPLPRTWRTTASASCGKRSPPRGGPGGRSGRGGLERRRPPLPEQDVQAVTADREDHGQRLVRETLAAQGRPGRPVRPGRLGAAACFSPGSLRLIFWHVRMVLSHWVLDFQAKMFYTLSRKPPHEIGADVASTERAPERVGPERTGGERTGGERAGGERAGGE